jgi:hypothetical protein
MTHTDAAPDTGHAGHAAGRATFTSFETSTADDWAIITAQLAVTQTTC